MRSPPCSAASPLRSPPPRPSPPHPPPHPRPWSRRVAAVRRNGKGGGGRIIMGISPSARQLWSRSGDLGDGRGGGASGRRPQLSPASPTRPRRHAPGRGESRPRAGLAGPAAPEPEGGSAMVGCTPAIRLRHGQASPPVLAATPPLLIPESGRGADHHHEGLPRGPGGSGAGGLGNALGGSPPAIAPRPGHTLPPAPAASPSVPESRGRGGPGRRGAGGGLGEAQRRVIATARSYHPPP